MSEHIPEGSRYRIEEPPKDGRDIACTRPVKCNRCYCVFEADDMVSGRCPGCQYRWTVETQSAEVTP